MLRSLHLFTDMEDVRADVNFTKSPRRLPRIIEDHDVIT